MWLEFDGLRAAEYLDTAGLGANRPIYRPKTAAMGESVRDSMLYITAHSDTSALHLIGHLFLFMDALVQSSSAKRELRGNRLRISISKRQ